MKQFLLIFVITVLYINLSISLEFGEKFGWKFIEYDWDSEEDKQAAIDDGSYVKGESLPADVDQFIKDEYDEEGEISKRTVITFITVIRRPGVPASLTTITDKEGEGGLLLRPYPDWSATKDCSGYTNVHRIAISRCGQLWILDSGKIEDEQVCPPKLTIIDLKTDEKINEMEIPDQPEEGVLTNIVVQPLDDECKNSAAFIADSYGNALVIYDGEKFCRLTGPEFEPQPDAEDITIEEDTITKKTGILGLSLTPYENDTNDQELYFRQLASFDLYKADTKELRDYCNTGNKPTLEKLQTALPSQSIAQVIDGNGVLFYSSVEGTSVNCWSTYEKFTTDKMVTLEQNVEKFQWITGMKVVPPEKPLGTLLVLSIRYPKFKHKKLNFDETNYRVLDTNTYLAIYGTDCY